MCEPETGWPLEKLPIGMQAFETLRGQGYLCVDKARWVHRLVTLGMFGFLARPRRFGKWKPAASRLAGVGSRSGSTFTSISRVLKRPAATCCFVRALRLTDTPFLLIME